MATGLFVLAFLAAAHCLCLYATRCRHPDDATHREWRNGVWRLRCRDCGRVSHGIQIGRRAA